MNKNIIDDFKLYEFSAPDPKILLFFAHANGVPALTYSGLFKSLSQQLPIKIISYDVRAFALSKKAPEYSAKKWGWNILVDDHCKIFDYVISQNKDIKTVVGCGHSLGSWLSLLSTPHTGLTNLILLDPPILVPTLIFQWFFAHLAGKQSFSPQSQKVRRRKIKYESKADALENLKRSSFMKNWDESEILNYIEASFEKKEPTGELFLRHDPLWESHMYEQYPPTAAQAFLTIPKKIRHSLKPIFLVGENSDTCNPKAKNWIKRFFPDMEWTIMKKSGHMFPIENKPATLDVLSYYLGNIYEGNKT